MFGSLLHKGFKDSLQRTFPQLPLVKVQASYFSRHSPVVLFVFRDPLVFFRYFQLLLFRFVCLPLDISLNFWMQFPSTLDGHGLQLLFSTPPLCPCSFLSDYPPPPPPFFFFFFVPVSSFVQYLKSSGPPEGKRQHIRSYPVQVLRFSSATLASNIQVPARALTKAKSIPLFQL